MQQPASASSNAFSSGNKLSRLSLRVRKHVYKVAFLVLDLWVIGRWFGLKALSLFAHAVFGRGPKIELALIRIGNVIFRRRYSDEMYLGYDTYVRCYPADLTVYADLLSGQPGLRGKTILEIGSGLGHYGVALLKEEAALVVGVEIQLKKTLWAHRTYQSVQRLHFVAGSATCLPFKDAAFDCAFSHTVFEHIDDVGQALREAQRILKPGGLFVLGVNYIHHRGGHHLFPYVHFPWAPWIVGEEALCRYWSDRVAADQARGRAGFYEPGARLVDLSGGEEIRLNRYTYCEFERLISPAGFTVVARRSSETLGRWLPLMLKIPKISPFMTGTVHYVLQKD